MFSVKQFKSGGKWTNWAGNIIAYPGEAKLPKTVEEVCHIVHDTKASGKNIRVTGAAHSFSAVAMPNHVALSLHHMRGLINADSQTGEATFWAGTYLFEIGPALANYGLALANMGDIQQQTLAGAISTGTHGTGIGLGSLSSMVLVWGFVDGSGEYREHHRGNDPLSEALHISLGMLGVLVKVTIQTVPLYSLHYVSTVEQFPHVLANFYEEIRENRHVEYYYFPGSESVQIKRMNEMATVKQATLEKLSNNLTQNIIENGLFFILSEACKINPRLSQRVSKLSATNVTKGEKKGFSYEIFPSARLVKFQETEYAIPLKKFEACMEEIHTILTKKRFNVHFPIECRTSAGEAGYLSPTQGEETAYLAFHMYKGMDEGPYFKWVYELMKKYNGRPHWGKMHELTRDEITQLYPGVLNFLEIRSEMDPSNVFMSQYLEKTFLKK